MSGASTEKDRWGEPEKYKLTELEAYDAMLAFLEAYWKRGGGASDDLAVLLGSINRNIWADLGPGDPAQWNDWMDAVEKVKSRV
jgi:hypothetical protein